MATQTYLKIFLFHSHSLWLLFYLCLESSLVNKSRVHSFIKNLHSMCTQLLFFSFLHLYTFTQYLISIILYTHTHTHFLSTFHKIFEHTHPNTPPNLIALFLYYCCCFYCKPWCKQFQIKFYFSTTFLTFDLSNCFSTECVCVCVTSFCFPTCCLETRFVFKIKTIFTLQWKTKMRVETVFHCVNQTTYANDLFSKISCPTHTHGQENDNN